jgi:PAS domain S-box-containing protein
MSVKRCWPRNHARGERWAFLAVAVFAVAMAAVCSSVVQPAQAVAAQESVLASATASPEPTADTSSTGALLFLGNEKLAPVVYLDGTTPAGLAVDLVHALAAHMSRPVEIRAMDWKRAQSIVAEGKADALIQINSTPERKEIYDFSEPFLESHFAIFVRGDRTGISGISSLRGLRVGVESGGLPEQLLGKDERIPLTVIPSFPDGFRMLDAGTIDAVVVDYRVGAYVLANSGIENIKAAGHPIASSYSAIAVKKGNTALLSDINSALATIKADGTYKRIIADWAPTEGVFETQAQISERVYRAAAVVFLILLVVVSAWAVTLRTQMIRKRAAEEALGEREETYRSLVTTMAEGAVFQGADGRITAVNPAAERILGRGADELLGRKPEDVRPLALREDGSPFAEGDLPGTDALRTGESATDVVIGIGRPPDDELRWISTNSQPLISPGGSLPHAVITTFHDITERKSAEEALRVSRVKLTFLLEQALLGVIEWDTDFRVTEWNPAAEAIFGYSREEAVGRRGTDLIVPEEVWAEVDAVWESLLQQTGGRLHTNENVTKDGRAILCEWVNAPLTDDSGAVVGVIALVRDVTERKLAEEMRVAKTAAEAASAAKTAFLANMSHEIRTPMNAILGFSQLMRHEKGLSERQQQQLGIIGASGEHLLALINDVLEMSKIEAGRITVHPSAFDLHSLLHEMESMFELRAQAKGLGLRIAFEEDVPRFVVSDENKLRQVLVNLLGNAVKFTDEGHVELRVMVRSDDEGRLRLFAEVRDTGIGVAPENMERLFHYFEQVAYGPEGQLGTGLGLTISREFVHALGGEIAVESELGIGSTFSFDIAIEEATVSEVEAEDEARRVVRLCPGEPRYRVLVADDAPDNRELLVELLEPIGFDVRSVANGREAFDEFEEWRPQVILMDMRMPVMDGYEATRRIRSAPGGAEVAIIGVTASAFAEMRQGVFDAGVDDFVVKPFHEGELLGKIGKLLNLHYIYEQRATGGAEPHTAGALDLATVGRLPAELRSRIRHAAISADFDAVLELVDEVGRHDEGTAVALRTLAERFDSERILAAFDRGKTR